MATNPDGAKKKNTILNTLVEWFPAILLFLGTIVLWQTLVTLLEVPRYVLPSPLNILEIIVKRGSDLMTQVGWTMLEAIFGFTLGAGVAFILCQCPLETVRARLTRREAEVSISDGRLEILDMQAQDFEPLTPADRPLLRLDTGRGPEEVLSEAEAFLAELLAHPHL